MCGEKTSTLLVCSDGSIHDECERNERVGQVLSGESENVYRNVRVRIILRERIRIRQNKRLQEGVATQKLPTSDLFTRNMSAHLRLQILGPAMRSHER